MCRGVTATAAAVVLERPIRILCRERGPHGIHKQRFVSSLETEMLDEINSLHEINFSDFSAGIEKQQ